METLTKRAESIRLERQKLNTSIEAEIQEKRKQEIAELRGEFKIGFAEILPMLREAKIKYSAHFNSQWNHEGSYILFKKGNKELKMDFSNRNSYRYEYCGYMHKHRHMTMTYGRWSMDDFILFIDQNLLK